MTSLFIHIYPPFTFTVIRCVFRLFWLSACSDLERDRHFYPGSEERFPALKELRHLHPWKALLLSSVICKNGHVSI